MFSKVLNILFKLSNFDIYPKIIYCTGYVISFVHHVFVLTQPISFWKNIINKKNINLFINITISLFIYDKLR